MQIINPVLADSLTNNGSCLLLTTLLRQATTFSTCATYILNVARHSNRNLHSERDNYFEKIFHCSDHFTIKLHIACVGQHRKAVSDKYRSYGPAGYDVMIRT